VQSSSSPRFPAPARAVDALLLPACAENEPGRATVGTRRPPLHQVIQLMKDRIVDRYIEPDAVRSGLVEYLIQRFIW
jgi:hypothetical protein